MTVPSIYNFVADFLASMNPARILELKPAMEDQERLEELIEKEKQAALSKQEKDELDHYIVLERLIRLMKANPILRLSQS